MRRKSSTFDACQLEKLAVCIATRLAGWDTPSIRWFVGLLGLTNHSGQTLFRNLPTVSTVATVTWSTRLFPVIGGIQTIIPIQGCGNYSLAYRRISFRKGPCDMCPNMPRRFFFALDQSMSFNSATWFTKMSRMLCILMVHSKLCACHLSLQLFRAHRWCDLAMVFHHGPVLLLGEMPSGVLVAKSQHQVADVFSLGAQLGFWIRGWFYLHSL